MKASDFIPDYRLKPSAKSVPDRFRSQCRAQVKLDGYRVTCFVEKQGTSRLMGRQPFKYMDVELRHLFEDGRNLEWTRWLPNDTVVDGELVVPGKPATEVPRAIASCSKDIEFKPFAWPVLGGVDLRHKRLREAELFVGMTEFGHAVRYEFPSFEFMPQDYELKGDFEMCELARKLGVEGFVAKLGNYFGWYKIKPVDTVDVFVVDTKPGLGKHEGRIGALECAVVVDNDASADEHMKLVVSEALPNGLGATLRVLSGVPVRFVASVGKGCDDQWRDLKPENLIGRVLEISHEGVQAGGRLKFSSFVRWRNDKQPVECKFTQLGEYARQEGELGKRSL